MSDATLLVFARCTGFAFRAPGFSHPAVPPPLRAGFAFALALALAPREVRVAHAALPLAVAGEAALGAALGVAASLLYDGAYAGGRLVDDYVGIRVNVPTAGVAGADGFARLWSLAFTTAFFTLGGDRIALGALSDSFAKLPPGALAGALDLRAFACTLPGTLVRAALLVSGPALACIFAANLALASLARVVPRFSPFSLAFGLAFALALSATLVSLPATVSWAARPWLVPLAR